MFRDGRRIASPADLHALEQSVIGAYWANSGDQKIRRWALNALAQFGREQKCKETIVHALDNFASDPETAASAVAALVSTSRDAQTYLTKKNIIDRDLIVLAALQTGSHKDIDHSETRINIEKADADILKLALLIVGLDKAPANLFHPNHSNAKIVNVLGGHHDQFVAQYSVWAITENVNLGISDLGISLQDVESKKPNVRSWVFQLIGADATFAATNMEYIRLGAEDLVDEPRRGLALGLRETYFDGLEAFVQDWLFKEPDEEVRRLLVDHLVRQAGRYQGYEDLAVQLYQDHRANSPERARMEASASGTALYAKFKRMSLESEADLFSAAPRSSRGEITVNNTCNVGGNLSGNISVGGDAVNSGNLTASISAEVVEKSLAELNASRELLARAGLSKEGKEEIERAIDDAVANPTREKVARAGELLKKVDDVAKRTAATSGALEKIVAHGAKILTLLGLL